MLPLKLCSLVILKWLDCKSNMWVESNGGTTWSNPLILWKLQKAIFNMLRWGKNNSSMIVKSTTQYCQYTTLNAIMISYFGNHISSSKMSLSYPFTLFLDLIHYHAKSNFSDKLRSCYTFNVRTINRVLVSREKNARYYASFLPFK
jgi:hypothetical protein